MQGKQCLWLALVLAATSGSSALVGSRLAPILPEVERHLDQARDDVERGSFDSAMGHTTAVLVGDEITYSVSYKSIPNSLRATCRKSLDQAFAAWQRDTDDTIRFREANANDDAQIRVVFKPDVRMGDEQVAGFTNWKRAIRMNGDHLVDVQYHADMQLRAFDLDCHPMTMEAMRHEACHETGHVLGLDDSPYRGDLMGPLDMDHPVNGPTAREALAVRNLRDEAKRIHGAALAQDAGKL